MTDQILQMLEEIEQAEKVHIIYAAETGSRAWGFESLKSDYDVRFIYARPIKDYLRLVRPRDVIEWQLDETYDITGWDIQKALLLLKKGNPTVLEWANSPIIYRRNRVWDILSENLSQFFNVKGSLHYYSAIAQKNLPALTRSDLVEPKLYLHILRAVLAFKWLCETQSQPPISFHVLTEAQLESHMQPVVAKLLDIKKSPDGELPIPRFAGLDYYIENKVRWMSEYLDTFQQSQIDDDNIDMEELFLRIMYSSEYYKEKK